MQINVCKNRALGIRMPLPGLLNNKYRQAVRIMKITAFILLVCSLHVSAGGFSQSITLSEKDAPLTKVFKSIEKQTDYIFFYNVEWVSKTDKVNVEVKNMQLKQVLDLLFKNLPIMYSITGKMITVFPKQNETSEVTDGMRPPIEIHGKVVDENGKPIPGVTVTVKGTTKQTLTDENGEFTFSEIEEHAVLSFSSVNMEAFEINVRGQSEILAKLKTKTSELDEVQVIAYGQTSKRLQTGNISSVKSEDIERQSVNNPLLALQARVPGLLITQGTGFSGSGVKITIQGINSLTKGNSPLYVINGIPYTSQLLPNYGAMLGTSNANPLSGFDAISGNPLSFINPGDIESIEVLKDADATAIYGSRAANGAILISTKSGKSGPLKVNVDLQTGWGKVSRKMNLLNSRQYLDMRYEALKNDGLSPTSADFDLTLWDTTRSTDWQNELIGGTARYTNTSVTVSGGSANSQYFIGGTWHRETTVLPAEFSDEKASVNFNFNDISANQKFRIQFSGSYMFDNNLLPNYDITEDALNLAPVAPPLRNSDGSLNWAPNISGSSSWTNPLSYLLNKYKNKTNNLISNVIISYQILKDLDIKSSFGYTSLRSDETIIAPLSAISPENRLYATRVGNYGENNLNSWIIEPQLTYKRKIGKVKLDALIGYTIQRNNSAGRQLYAFGFNSDDVIENMQSAGTVGVGSTISSIYKYNAVFSRLNFNWKDKYIVDFTARRDGSSRFGAANQFHNFGAIGGAWIFSNEKVMKDNFRFISFGKFKGSYGTTGNEQIGDYQFLSLYFPTYAQVAYQGMTGLAPASLPNPYLQWEETKKLQFGIDLGLFSERVLINVNYFRNRSSNQLVGYTLPIMTGFSNITRNFPAVVQNTGWELFLQSTVIKTKEFSWSTSINLTVPKNKLIAFPDLNSSPFNNSLAIGKPITVIKAFHYLGVDPATGVYQFADSSGKATFTPDFSKDRSAYINTSPTFYGGLQNHFQYKGVELDFLFQYVRQRGANSFFGLLPGTTGRNQPTSVLDRWQRPGDIASHQRFNSNYSVIGGWINAQNSDSKYSDASFFRLKNVSLSWQLPQMWRSKVRLQSCRLYIQGQNLLTKSNYVGLDPENPGSRSMPPLRLLTIGVQATL